MFQTNRFRLLIVTACVLAFAAAAAAEGIAIVNTQRAILETAEIQKAQAAMEADFKPRQDEITKLQQDLQGIDQQLQTMAGKLTPQAQNDLSIQAQRKQRDLQRLTEDLQADVTNRRNDVLGKVGQGMQEVVQKLAEEQGLDVVIDVQNTIYFKPALDLTQQAIDGYNAAYPVQ
jgi:outer membrane protein